MKKQLLTIAASLLLTGYSHAQGTFQFNNFSAVVNAPITDIGGALITDTTGRYVAEMAYVVGGGNGAALASWNDSTVASLAGVRENFVGFDGYFLSPAAQAIPGQPQGTVITMVIRAFDTTTGSSWLESTVRGQSNPINYTLAGTTTPPSELIGLTGFQLQAIPEPSTFVLAGLGIASLLLFRRRK
jgi:hypothetical protein